MHHDPTTQKWEIHLNVGKPCKLSAPSDQLFRCESCVLYIFTESIGMHFYTDFTRWKWGAILVDCNQDRKSLLSTNKMKSWERSVYGSCTLKLCCVNLNREEWFCTPVSAPAFEMCIQVVQWLCEGKHESVTLMRRSNAKQNFGKCTCWSSRETIERDKVRWATQRLG